MALQTLTGDDVFIIDDNPLILDMTNGDIVTIDFPDELFKLTIGKNGNAIYAKNESGRQSDIVIKITRGSSSDKLLNGKLATQERDFVGFTLMNGAFVKRLGDGNGKITYDTYNLKGMMFTKIPNSKANTEGDGDQVSATYNLKAASVTRGII